MSSLEGAVGRTLTVPAVGAVLATVTVRATVPLARPPGSVANTSTGSRRRGRRCPARDRSSVAAVAPAIAVPFRSQL